MTVIAQAARGGSECYRRGARAVAGEPGRAGAGRLDR